MPLADDPLLGNVEEVVEGGRGKPLAPDLARKRVREVERELGRLEAAVRRLKAGEIRRRQHLARDGLEGGGESRQVGLGQRKARRIRVTAEAGDHAGRALRHDIQRVAQMESGNRASRPLELAAGATRKDDRGTVIAILEPRRHDADDALVPFGAKETKRVRVIRASRRASSSACASSCIVASTSRRSRFSRSSSVASGNAEIAVSASRQRMPIVMSASRPAALRRGPATKPRS